MIGWKMKENGKEWEKRKPPTHVGEEVVVFSNNIPSPTGERAAESGYDLFI